MNQSGDSLAQKSGTFPDRQNPRAFYSCRLLMPLSSQLHLHRFVTSKSRDCGTKEDGGGRLTQRPHSLAKALRLGLIASIGRTSCGNFPSKTETPGRKSRSEGKTMNGFSNGSSPGAANAHRPPSSEQQASELSTLCIAQGVCCHEYRPPCRADLLAKNFGVASRHAVALREGRSGVAGSRTILKNNKLRSSSAGLLLCSR
jgi:hypothetical protein